MGRILVVGNATLDIIHSVDHYPHEDEELRATAQRRQRGGNAANSAVILAQHGHRVSFAGTLADDAAGREIAADLRQHGVELDHCQTVVAGHSPLSCITHNLQTGSRTIVHYRDLPEYPAEAFAAIALAEFDWFHFEGRNPAQLRLMLDQLQRVRVDQPISLEVEKVRPGIESLFAQADILLLSRAYAQAQGYLTPEAVFAYLQTLAHPGIQVCSWGEQGAYARQAGADVLHQPAQVLAHICDSVGAGDTFNAGLIHSLLGGQPLSAALAYANELAARKLQQLGFDRLLD